MKDIYDLMNDIEVLEEEMEEDEVTLLEKERMKQNIKKQLKKQKKWKKNQLIAAGICLAVIVGTGAIGILNPAYAAEIPIVGDIFRFLDNGRTGLYEKYKEYSTEIDITKENNGVSISIKDAVFDGRTISYTYEVVTNENLGKEIFFPGQMLSVKGYTGGMGGSSQVVKVGENSYVGQSTSTIHVEKDAVDFQLSFDKIGYFDSNQEYREIKGRWEFLIHLDAVNSNKQNVNQTVKRGDIAITVDAITKTPMSVIIQYKTEFPEKYVKDTMNSPDVQITIKDDLGNVYETDGATSYKNLNEPQYYTVTIKNIVPEAKKLIITPSIFVPSGGGGMEIGEDGKETLIEWEENPDQAFLEGLVFDDIMIDLQL